LGIYTHTHTRPHTHTDPELMGIDTKNKFYVTYIHRYAKTHILLAAIFVFKMASFIKLANNMSNALNAILDTGNMGLGTKIKYICAHILRYEQDKY
jgi:hypothetical protein